MNRRGWALVLGVLAAILGGAWWWGASSVIVEPTRRPRGPLVEAPSPPRPAQVVVTPAPVDASPDAGVLAELAIEVVQNGRQLVGTRVELEGASGRVSRPTDVMGFARFTLPVGTWRITRPSLPSSDVPLEVVAPSTQFRHELPSLWHYRLRVVDDRGEPVPGAKVSWGERDGEAFTDSLGELKLERIEPALQVQASRGTSRSIVRAATPGQLLTLVLETWTRLDVKVRGPGGGSTYVRVMHRDELVSAGLLGEPMPVPLGSLSVLVRRNVKGRVHSGQAQVEAREGITNEVEVALAPAPPITGKVVDSSGRPLPGVGLHFREVNVSELLQTSELSFEQALELEALALQADGGLARLPASTRTSSDGTFAWTPELSRGPDPVFQLVVVEAWRSKVGGMSVRLDDAPLTVEVGPAP